MGHRMGWRREGIVMALHPKVTAGVVAGAVVSLLIAEANRRGYTIAPDEASALTVLLTFGAGYMVPSNGADGPPAPPFVPARQP
jgi:hypothetical protein